jgi:hypothetical protein
LSSGFKISLFIPTATTIRLLGLVSVDTLTSQGQELTVTYSNFINRQIVIEMIDLTRINYNNYLQKSLEASL